MTIAAAGHPIAAGLSGHADVPGQSRTRVLWGRPTATATTVATTTGSASVFALEEGAAAGRRVAGAVLPA